MRISNIWKDALKSLFVADEQGRQIDFAGSISQLEQCIGVQSIVIPKIAFTNSETKLASKDILFARRKTLKNEI